MNSNKTIARNESNRQFTLANQKHALADETQEQQTQAAPPADTPEGAGWLVIFGSIGITLGACLSAFAVIGTCKAIAWFGEKYGF